MFCKNCGATISAADEKCARCGFKAPALSDCGGFYDLAPNAPKPAPVPQSAPPAAAPAPKKSEGMGRWIVPSILALVILALQVFIFVKLADHENRLNNLFSMLEDVEEEQTAPAPSGDQDNNDDPQPTDPETTPSTEPEASQQPGSPDDPEPSIPDETEPPTTAPTEERSWFNRLICIEDDLEKDNAALLYLDGEKAEFARAREDGEGRTAITYRCDAESDRNIVVKIEDFANNLYKVYCSLYGDFGTLSLPGTINIYDGETLVCDPLEAAIEGETIFAEVDLSAVAPGKSLRCEICWDNEEDGCVTITLDGLTVKETLLSQKDILIYDKIQKNDEAFRAENAAFQRSYKKDNGTRIFTYTLTDDPTHSVTVYCSPAEEGMNITCAVKGPDFGTFDDTGSLTVFRTVDGYTGDAITTIEGGAIRDDGDTLLFDLQVQEPGEVPDPYVFEIRWPNADGGAIVVNFADVEF